jgi:hypothetical protein
MEDVICVLEVVRHLREAELEGKVKEGFVMELLGAHFDTTKVEY